jgi:hypothetical protein
MCPACLLACLTLNILLILSSGFSPADDANKNIMMRSELEPLDEQSLEQKQQLFVQEVQGTIDELRGGTRLKHFEAALASVYTTLPRDENGDVGKTAVRIALKFLLEPQQDRHGSDATTSEFLSRKVPAKLIALYVQELLEQQTGRTSLDGNDIALILATVEHLLGDKIIERFGEQDLHNIVSMSLREMNMQSVEVGGDATIQAVIPLGGRRPSHSLLQEPPVAAVSLAAMGSVDRNEMKIRNTFRLGKGDISGSSDDEEEGSSHDEEELGARHVVVKKVKKVEKPAPVDCQWELWQDWTPCTATCGKGTRSHKRTKEAAKNGGAACKGDEHEEAFCPLPEIDCTEKSIEAKEAKPEASEAKPEASEAKSEAAATEAKPEDEVAAEAKPEAKQKAGTMEQKMSALVVIGAVLPFIARA